MKFTWGTGIFIFLTVFLLAAAAFMVFAFNQDVNLVHKEYYEKGVDYTDQMNIEARSQQYHNNLNTRFDDDFLIIDFDESLAQKVDSGNALLFRPSSSRKDIDYSLNLSENSFLIPKQDLSSGRYILKLSWYSEGLKYQVDMPVNVIKE